MTVVVTGAAGHIGANLVRELIARGSRVRVVVHNRTAAIEGLDVEKVQADILDGEQVQRAVAGAETVFHLAGRISIDGGKRGAVLSVNVNGTSNVVRACLDHGVSRLVHFSSIHAFDPKPTDESIDETRARITERAQVMADYDRSKALGERVVRDGVGEGLDAVIVHPTGVIGPNDFEPSRTGRMLLKLYERKMPALVAGGFNWVDVRDVVAGALAARERGRRGESYLLGGHWTTLGELAKEAEEITGVPAPRLVAPIALARMGAPIVAAWARLLGKEALYTSESLSTVCAYRYVSHAKASRELGYEPRPLRVTIQDTYRWFASNGQVPASLFDRTRDGRHA
jgi:dihydroflavonol-4-reductase